LREGVPCNEGGELTVAINIIFSVVWYLVSLWELF
jgi:hypothetical protein